MERDPQAIHIGLHVPPRATRKFRARQLLHALARIDLEDPRPGLYVLNEAGVGHFLFSARDRAEGEAKFERLVAELEEIGGARFMERYGVPLSFLDETEWRPRKRRLEPLL